MNKIACVFVMVLAGITGWGQEPSAILDLQTEAYLSFVNAKEALDGGNMQDALQAYQKALSGYQRIQKMDPGFKTDIVAHRVTECNGQVEKIRRQLQASGSPAPAGGAPPRKLASQPPGPTRIGETGTPRPRPRTTPTPKATAPATGTPTQSADLEYMEKYIELLKEVKVLKEKMVLLENREETGNMTIRGLSKQVDELTAERADMLKTIEKANTRNNDLLEALDAAEKFESEAARSKVALKQAQDRYTVLDAKLSTVEQEFQNGKASVIKNQQAADRMKQELDQETARANNLSVENAKLKNEVGTLKEEMATPDPKLAQLREEKKELDRKLKTQRDGRQKQIDNLNTRLDETGKARTAAETEVENLKAEVARLTENAPDAEAMQQQIDTLTGEKEALQQVINETPDVEALNAKLEMLAEEKQALQQMVDEAPDADALNEQIATLTATNEELQTTLEEKTIALEQGNAAAMALVELETRFASATNEVATLSKQADMLKDQLAAVAEDEGLAGRLAGLVEENEVLKARLSDLEGASAALELELNSRMDAESDARSENGRAVARIKELQMNVEALKSSAAAAATSIDSLKSENEALVKANTNLARQLESLQNSSQEKMGEEIGRWQKEKLALQKTHDEALADQVKEINALRTDVAQLSSKFENEKAQAAAARSALSAKDRELTQMSRMAGNATADTGRLAKQITALQLDKQKLEQSLAAEKTRADNTAQSATETSRELGRLQGVSDRLSAAAKKSSTEHSAEVASISAERDAALEQLERHKTVLKQKEEELSTLKKQAEKASVGRPARAGLGTIVPLSALERASGVIPFVDVQSDGQGGLVVTYPGIGIVAVE